MPPGAAAAGSCRGVLSPTLRGNKISKLVPFPTSLVTHWGRDRARLSREGLPLEWLIKRQCRDTAELVGLRDRGLLAPGHKADVNLIDFENLHVRAPEMAYDLPTGAPRLVQRAEGYEATLVSGEVNPDVFVIDKLSNTIVDRRKGDGADNLCLDDTQVD